MASRKVFNYESVILNKITVEMEGYHPDKYGPASAKFIWARCRFCGKASRIRKGFFNKAGSACHKECRFKEQSLAGSPFKDPNVQEKTRKTNLARYGTEHACQNKEIAKRISSSRSTEENKNKIKSTNFKKYGVKNPFQSEEIKAKIKKTNLKKYGHEHAMQSDEIKDKTKKTNQDRYGVNNPMQSKKVQDKVIRTNLDKYGVANPMQNQYVQSKVKQTNLDKYGVENPMQNEEIRQKTYETNLQRYDYAHVLQNKEMMTLATKNFKTKVTENESGCFTLSNTLRGDKFWEKMKLGKSLRQLAESFGIQENSLRSRILNPEFVQNYYKTYTFPKNQMQKQVIDSLQKYDLDIIFNDRKAIIPLELDIYIPKYNFAIEFNGCFWHSEKWLGTAAKWKHRRKTDICRKKGIRLFHIFEHQWKKRQSQILNFIKTIIGANKNRIPARKCKVTNDECKGFFDDNHIQGYGIRTLKFFNLVYDNEIIASMTASKHHRQNGAEGAIILNRLCFKDGFNVQGGASKLFTRMVDWAQKEQYNSIKSWSNLCWTEGNIYRVLGFELAKEYSPDYFYWDLKKHKYYSKQSQQKKKTGCPKELTEREWCIERGLTRIWDCGKRLWQFKL